ncbi:MAG: methionyl-tRNA formyltransferase [Pirellulales bacterium]
MRLIMMGTGPFAVPTFEALLDSPHQVLALYTRPSPPFRGRGPAPVNPMRAAAERRQVAVFDPPSINDSTVQTQLADWGADLLVVCDYGQILKSTTLAAARLGGINLHGSLLPRYRGAAPVQWAVFHGDAETGVSVIHMTPQLDGGPVIAVRRTPIGAEETAGELEPRLAQLGVEPVFEALDKLAAWDGVASLGAVQDPAAATKAPRLTKQDGELDWRRTARELHNQVRAFQPWPGSFTHWTSPKGESIRLIVTRVAVEAGAAPPDSAPPGTVLECQAGRLVVAAGSGTVRIERLQPAGKRVLEAAEFLRGYPLAVGERLGSASGASEQGMKEAGS